MIELNKDQIARLTSTLNRLHHDMVEAEENDRHAYLAGKTWGMSRVLHEIGYDVCYDMDQDRLYLTQEVHI